VPEGEYSDCMEIKQAMNTKSTRQVYVKYKPVSIYIGPNKRRTEVLCDLANEGNRPGGWTVCTSKMYFNLQLI